MASWQPAPSSVYADAAPAGTPESTTDSGGSYYSGSGGYSAPVAPNYDWMIQDSLNRLGGVESRGRQNILDSYNSAFNALTNSKTRAQEDFDSQRTKTQQDNVRARENINSSVRNTLTGLQRLLGARGAGASSAAKVLAPYAAGLQGNNQLQDVSRTYGDNMGAIDTGWKRAQEDFENKFGDLNTDRGNKERGLAGQIAQKRIELMQRLGSTDRSAIDALLNTVDDAGRVETFAPRQVDYTRPDLAAYNYAQAQQGKLNTATPEDGGLVGQLGGYYNLLKDKKQTVGA